MDNDYPQDGESYANGIYNPGEDQDRKEQESKEAAVIAASYPIMQDVAEWFDTQIKGCDSRKYITAYAQTHGKNPNDCADAFDIVRELLEIKRDSFGELSK
jgi:hypothetical protein